MAIANLKADEDRLTNEEKRLADTYLQTNDLVLAAKAYGFKGKYLSQAAYRRLKSSRIAKYVSEQQSLVANELSITPTEIKNRINKIAESAKNDSDKLRALELLAKINGMFAELVGKENKVLAQQFFVTVNIDRLSRVKNVSVSSIPPNPPSAASISTSQSTSSPSVEHSTIDTSASCLDTDEPTTRVDNISLPKEVNIPPEGSCDSNKDLHKSVSQILTLDTYATSQESGKESETNTPITLRRSDDDTT